MCPVDAEVGAGEELYEGLVALVGFEQGEEIRILLARVIVGEVWDGGR